MRNRLLRRLAPVWLAGLLLAGCAGEQPPLRIGYIGGLTGRTADLGTGGRNGVQIAVDAVNARGGVKGRKVELILKDDMNDPAVAQQAVRELIAAKVEVILGPMTSGIAVAVAPLATEANVLMVAGSVTTDELSGKDDQFFRTIAANTIHAATMAEHLYQKRGVRRVNAALNYSNKAYADSWFTNFATAFTQLGGSIGERVTYTSGADTEFHALTRKLAVGRPDAIVLVTNAVDTTLFANQVRQQKVSALMATAEWAGTGKLIELGGGNVEGFIVPQYLDPHANKPEFIAFRDAYRQRFQQDLGFPGVLAYDAAQVALRSLAERQAGESLKQTLLRLRTFPGLQGDLVFDAYGDTQGKTFLTEVRNGKYVYSN